MRVGDTEVSENPSEQVKKTETENKGVDWTGYGAMIGMLIGMLIGILNAVFIRPSDWEAVVMGWTASGCLIGLAIGFAIGWALQN